jgi:prevent-host-death family protein
MRRAGIREARQNLTSLLEDVKKGREVVIADRGSPVAMLVPIQGRRPFPDLRGIRKRTRGRELQLTQAVVDHREDR